MPRTSGCGSVQGQTERLQNTDCKHGGLQAIPRQGGDERADHGHYGPVTALNVNRQWLETNRDTARRLLQSVVDGTRAFRTDKELGIRTLQHWFKVDDPALLEATYAYFSPMLPDYVLPAAEGIQRVIDEIPPDQLGGRRITADDLVDPSLARELRW